MKNESFICKKIKKYKKQLNRMETLDRMYFLFLCLTCIILWISSFGMIYRQYTKSYSYDMTSDGDIQVVIIPQMTYEENIRLGG